jgi:alginate O-acetyltransferase complex protein AlgI
MGSVFFNWVASYFIFSSTGKRKLSVLVTGITLNMIILIYFKYGVYFLEILSTLLGRRILAGFEPELPIGLSFYTFMSISFLIESYRSSLNKASFLQFASYLTLFPHLIAGPIVRFSEILPELSDTKRLTLEKFNLGLVRFCKGLGMKVLLANNLAPVVDEIFAQDKGSLAFHEAWLGAVAYSLQIYFDFAGYTSMGIGLALMIGIGFPENFDRPYLARSVTEFWRKWHMTLSRWFRDYVYIPLGGNRKNNFRTSLNLMVVFILCGLWHGAATTFLVWGLYQGFFLLAERNLFRSEKVQNRHVVWVPIVFTITTLGWVIFRSESLTQAAHFFKVMLRVDQLFILDSVSIAKPEMSFWYALVIGSLIIFLPPKVVASFERLPQPLLNIVHTATPLVLLITSTFFIVQSSFQPFIYFRF